MGSDDRQKANEAFSMALILGVIFPLASAILIYLGLDSILDAFGCVEELKKDAYSYSVAYLMGAFGFTLIYLPFNFLRLLGKLRSSVCLFLGMATSNILLDIFCVKVLGMGMSGIAVGTVIPAIITSIIGIWILLRDKTGFSLTRPRSLSATFYMLKLGTPSALNNLLNFVRLFLLNRIIVAVANSSGLAAFSVLTALENLSVAIILSGLAQAASGFVSVFSKEMDTVSVRRVEKYALVFGLGIMLLLTSLVLTFPADICRLFGLLEAADISLATHAVSIFALCLLPSVPCFLLFFYYQAAGFTFLRNILVFCRSFLFIILPAWLLSTHYGLDGVWWSFLLAAICPLLVAIVATLYYRKQGYEGILLQNLLAEREGRYLSFTIPSNTEDIVSVAKQLGNFCTKNGLTPQETMTLQLSTEEMLVSIKDHCFTPNTHASADVRIIILQIKAKSMIILRIRNGGRYFNPLDYYERLRTNDPLALGDALGIAMILRMADSIHYKSTFGINNLTVIINRKDSAA